MKIALTGDSSGFGPYVRKALEKLGHEVLGISRTNGYDLSTELGRRLALEASSDCDVFINNSCAGGWQPQVLKEWIMKYYNQNKTVINISSNIALIKNPAKPYSQEWICKTTLNDIHNKFVNESDYHVKCQSKILSWGYWKNDPRVSAHPELLTETTIDQAVEEIIELI